MTYIPKPLLQSAALLHTWEKLCISRRPPRVNLLALARRDTPFMSCWLADPGYVFVSSDFTSLEPSITAHYSQDPNYKYATFDGVGKQPYVNPETGILMIDDIYLMTGSVFPKIGDTILSYFAKAENRQQWVDDSEVCKKILKKERNLAKPACLGFGYNMRAKKFHKTAYEAGLDISMEDAQGMYKAYWEVFSGVKLFSEKLSVAMKQRGSLTNVFGFRGTTEPHKAFNFLIQSTASGVLDLFCLKFFQKIADSNKVMIPTAVIHDELVYQIKEEDVESVKVLQEQAVVELNEALGWTVPMRLGFSTGKAFSELK